ncbi:MAG: outer membrane beta-barrel protein [bacterium]|nr:outer membrane beta-barrel protein [bacterium]
MNYKAKGNALKKCQIALLLQCSLNSAFAETMGSVGAEQFKFHPIVSFSIATDFINWGKAQNVLIVPPFYNHYTKTTSNTKALDLGVFLGLEHAITDLMMLQLGISVSSVSTIKPEGHVWQFGLPMFDNFIYNYSIHSTRFMQGGKLLANLARNNHIHPYFSWELGAANNKASRYTELQLDGLIPAMAPYSNHSQTSFAYGVGIGIDYTITQYARLGFGYQYLNLGAASLGLSPSVITGQTLNLSTLQSNQVRIQLSYLL